MTPGEAGAIFSAGIAAGAINTVVGSGSLVTFPTLLAFGYPALVANVSNTVGLVPGSISGVVGYRRELSGQQDRAVRLGIFALLGGLTGGLLLLALPPGTFRQIVPVLILGASALVLFQPLISRWVAQYRDSSVSQQWVLSATIYATAIYGGFFGAAQSVLFIALLAIFLDDHLQRLNGLKNVLAAVVNAVAAALFICIAPVSWLPAALIAAGAIIGGQVGALVGRRLSPALLRLAIVAVGAFAAMRLVLG